MSAPLINFLEKKTIRFKPEDWNYQIIAIALASLVGVFTAYGLIQKTRLGNHQEFYFELDAKVNQLKNIKGVNQEESPKDSKFAPLVGATIRWTPLINEISRQTPSAVWLDAIRGESGEEKSITIQGGAGSTESIALFLDRLRTTGVFKKVWSPSSEKKEDHQGVQFLVKGLF